MKTTYTVQPYGSHLKFVTTRAEYDSIVYEPLAPDAYYSGAFGHHWKKESVYILGVFDGSILTLVHEAVHAASTILNHSGIDPQSNEAEPLAYLVDHLVAVGAKRLKLSHQVG